jgi:hypothetical protein
MFTLSGKLRIFENFVDDRSLPKFKSKLKKGSKIMEGGDDLEGDESMTEGTFISMNGISIRTSDSDGVSLVTPASLPARRRWSRLCFWRRSRTAPPFEMSVEEFFHSVKDSVDELKVVDSRARGYEATIAKAAKAGQVAFVERLQQNLVAVRSESQLAAMGLSRYIEEEVLASFARKSSRALKLDWIRNFIRPIPEEILKRKLDLDERLIFDNYVVLHYDPSGTGSADTEKERAKKRDPILFGVLRGRRRLYHVGDWQDEVCDLTLDQIADAMGKESIRIL